MVGREQEGFARGWTWHRVQAHAGTAGAHHSAVIWGSQQVQRLHRESRVLSGSWLIVLTQGNVLT